MVTTATATTTAATAATEVTAGSSAAGAITTRSTTAARAAAAGTTTATASATGAVGLDEAVVDLEDLLGLALALALGLASGGGGVLVVLLDEGLGAGPLLVGLGALVGLAVADALFGLEGELLLGLLGEVVVVGDVLLLGLGGLGGLGLGVGCLSLGVLLLAGGDVLAGLLVLQLGLALGGAPGLSGLLVGTAAVGVVSFVGRAWSGERIRTKGGKENKLLPRQILGMPVVAVARKPRSPACFFFGELLVY